MSNQSVEQSGRIHGKVAGILNERELVINIGTNRGVKLGMKFKVLSSEGTIVYDPDTNEELGLVDREKVRVRATEVKNRLSICRTYRERIVGGSEFARLLAGTADALTVPRRIPETLKAEDAEYLPPLSEDESFVKAGDRVIQLLDIDD